ncbi:MAG: proton-conducting transporter membrane subunit [Bacteroidales bacterium]
MEKFSLIAVFLFIPGIFFIPPRLKYALTFILLLILIGLSSYASWLALAMNGQELYSSSIYLKGILDIPLLIDKISAFFILTVNITMLTGTLYAGKYLSDYREKQSPFAFSLHYLSLLLLYISMILVCMLREAFYFLAAWELMTLSSFILVIFEPGIRSTLKTGINYLIQMHIGMFILLTAFLITTRPGAIPGFDILPEYFQYHQNFPLFLLFFAGFGIKAGFIPFHTWLPDAHPAAPSHVSGIMSGVMIKMGIYGIVRVLMNIDSGFFEIGLFLLLISLLTGIYGVMQAIVQHDLKKLLAYHSIENIGIIGIGLGLGCLGLSTGNDMLAMLGFTGGLLHVLNHSLFKSLLFYTAGSVYQATHTRDINQLGGLIKKMPYTAAFFLLGSIAICGLPPLNGFISEFLIYLGIIGSLQKAGFYLSFILMLSLLGLTLIGGLALFCFTKATGIIFLGEARSKFSVAVKEASVSSFIPLGLIAVLIAGIGLMPLYFVDPLVKVVSQGLARPLPVFSSFGLALTLINMSLIFGVFLILVFSIILVRYLMTRKRTVTYGPTWGCGYTAPNKRMQYTASSFSDNFSGLTGKLVNVRKESEPIGEQDIFPGKRAFSSHSSELFETWVIDKPLQYLRKLIRNIAFLQTGQIQHYILYPFIYILIILILTIFNLL